MRVFLSVLILAAAPAAWATPQVHLAQLAGSVFAQEEEEEKSKLEGRQTKRTQTMREAVYKRLSAAQVAAEADDFATAEKELRAVENMKKLTP
ncbi:MAG: hypothetical protein AAGA23_14795, partial [Pseudomonadota bacterium]